MSEPLSETGRGQALPAADRPRRSGAAAIKQALARQISQLMAEKNLSKAEMARRMHTSRAAVNRLLDPDNKSVTLLTLEKAALALGKQLQVALVDDSQPASPTPTPATKPTTDRSAQATRRRRYREAGEPLTEDSSVRDALVDAEAQQLLNWGLKQVEQEVDRTLDLEDEKARAHLESFSGRVRAVMRQVNDLMAKLPESSDATAWEALLLLTQRLQALYPGSPTHSQSMREAFDLAQKRHTLDRDQLFKEIMDILPGESNSQTPPDDNT